MKVFLAGHFEVSFGEIKMHYFIENPDRDIIRYHDGYHLVFTNEQQFTVWEYLRSDQSAELSRRHTEALLEPLPQHLWPAGCFIFQKADPMTGEYLTEAQVEERYAPLIKVRQLRRWRWERQGGPDYYKIGKAPYYKPSDIDIFLEKQKVKGS